MLGLDPELLHGPDGARIFAGNELPEGTRPIAQAYAGHQFGHFTALGDGRAILLGEQIAPSGERWDIQLKGPGTTRYSRRGDRFWLFGYTLLFLAPILVLFAINLRAVGCVWLALWLVYLVFVFLYFPRMQTAR